MQASQIPTAGRAWPQPQLGTTAIPTARVTRATAARGRTSMVSPARYWERNSPSRRRGRACIMQAERAEYR